MKDRGLCKPVMGKPVLSSSHRGGGGGLGDDFRLRPKEIFEGGEVGHKLWGVGGDHSKHREQLLQRP